MLWACCYFWWGGSPGYPDNASAEPRSGCGLSPPGCAARARRRAHRRPRPRARFARRGARPPRHVDADPRARARAGRRRGRHPVRCRHGADDDPARARGQQARGRRRRHPARGGPGRGRGAPGAVVAFEVAEASGGQFDRGSSAADIENLSFDRANPGFGLLADEFAEPWMRIWDLPAGRTTATFADGVEVPLAAVAGTIGVAPPEPGPHPIVPPSAWGGNLDAENLTAGTRLHLPVSVGGALFSIGDTRAAQAGVRQLVGP